MSKFQAHKDAPDEVWLQIGYGYEGEHTWAPHEIAEDVIEEAGPYVRADRLSGRVTVAALEWEETQIARGDGMHEHDGGYEAVTPIGIYRIEMYFGSDSYVWEVSLPAVGKVADCDDPDTAKAAAQADFESRILAAIDTAPAPSPDQIRREALKDALDITYQEIDKLQMGPAVVALEKAAARIEALITGGADD